MGRQGGRGERRGREVREGGRDGEQRGGWKRGERDIREQRTILWMMTAHATYAPHTRVTQQSFQETENSTINKRIRGCVCVVGLYLS